MGALIAAAVADQRSRVPKSPVRTKIAEILARQRRHTFFLYRAPPTTCRSPVQSTSGTLKTRLAPSPTEAPLLARGRLEQLGVTRSCAPHTLLSRAPQESLHVYRGADSCSSCHECPISQETRQRLNSSLRGPSLSRLRLAARRAPVDRELTEMFRAPLPLASIPKGRRLKKSGNEETVVFPTTEETEEGES
jgi:hypothetical protein